MREEIVQKGQWIGLVAGTVFALTGTQKERKIAVCPTTHLQDDVCVTALLVRIGSLERRSIPTIHADSPRITSTSLRISPYLLGAKAAFLQAIAGHTGIAPLAAHNLEELLRSTPPPAT
jgi:hypothetical protein